jgi:CBS domain-containing protein
MKIKQIMVKPVLISPSITRKQILKTVKRHPNAATFIVVDKNKKFLGDIHENSLFYMLLPDELYEEIGIDFAFDLEKKFFAKTAEEIMRKHDVSCYEDEDIMDVAMRFASAEVDEMPVLNRKGKVVGVINQGIILRNLK